MNTTEKSKSILFIDYIPAVLRENKDWIIVFRVFNPLTNKLGINTSIGWRLKNHAYNLQSLNRKREYL